MTAPAPALDVDSLEAGRDLDALVAREVFGYTVTEQVINPDLLALGTDLYETHDYGFEPLPHYSTRDAEALEIVRELCRWDPKRGFAFLLKVTPAGGVKAEFQRPSEEFVGVGPSIAWAISRAALKAVGR